MSLRLTPEERKAVEEVAEENGLGLSDVIRLSIRTAHPDKFKKRKK